MNKIECSVWSNGASGWGLRILGGLEMRKRHFRRADNPILVELDGTLFPFNIDKKSFWTPQCGEVIGIQLGEWVTKHGLKPGDRVWLEVLKPFQTFKATTNA